MEKIKQLFLLAFLICGASIAQSIKGVLKDQKEPIMGATIMVKGSLVGTSTNFDGEFVLSTKSTNGILLISSVGYVKREIPFTITGSELNLNTIVLEPSSESLSEIVITATSYAIDRKTPVAVSNVKAIEIQEKLGNQEFPEILKSTPGIYATKSGGGFGDARVNIRGFNSENVAVMINGVPVNDMENGRVFWSNWAGLSDVTQTMQVQRGLGAAKIAVPSIGGTINILSKTSDVQAGGNIIAAIGNDGYQKYGFTLSTGLMDNGFASTVSFAKTSGEGYVDGTQFNGMNYFVNVTKVLNENHKLSFTTFGAPQRHGQRQNRSLISTYRNSEQGIKFNPDWGYKNGQVTHIEDNFYHKSQSSLNHYWDITDATSLSTALYASFGTGGGGGTAGTNRSLFNNRLGGSDQPVDLDNIVAINKANGALGSEAILRASRNDHRWYGVLSTLKTAVTEDIDVIAGVDVRSYIGEHFREVTDLLGGQYYLDNNDDNNPNNPAKVGDKMAYNNDGIVGWAGLFGQAEYDKDQISAFLSVAISNTEYKRIDYFNYLDSDPTRETDVYNFLGYSIKGGANYRIDNYHNIFANIGYFEKAPYFNAVFQNFNNVDINENAENQKIASAELGYGYRSSIFNANLNAYATKWSDRTFTQRLDGQNGEEFTANILGVDALHMGVELDFVYKPLQQLSFTGMLSVGNWEWDSDILDTPIFDDNQQQVATIDLLVKGLKVSDAAQTTAALGLKYNVLPTTSITVDYNYYDNLFADFEVTDTANITETGDIKTASGRKSSTWKVPSYSLFDLGFTHKFKIGQFDAKIIANMNNVFNTTYISDAQDGSGSNAATALVWYGFGRTFSVSTKINF